MTEDAIPASERLREATDLLTQLRWRKSATGDGRFEVWAAPDGSPEVIVPLDTSAGDFNGLMVRLLRDVRNFDAGAYESATRMAATLAEASLETTQWHKETALPPGLIVWGAGESLHALAREQLAAAAKAAVEKRRYFGNRVSYIAGKFLDRTYMGVPEAASYVVTALTPRHERLYTSKAAETRATAAEPRLLDPETITGGEIITAYERALGALRVGLDEYSRAPRLEPFLEAVNEGVSYELSRSLEAIVAGGDTSVSIFRQSRATPSTQIEFKAAEAAVLGRVTTALAVDTEPRRVQIIGEVTLLKREHDSRDRLIRLDVLSGDSELNKARIRLTAEQYEIAIEAHRSEGALQVSGVITREGNLFWMYQVDSLRVVGPPPQGDGGASSGSPVAVQENLTGYDE